MAGVVVSRYGENSPAFAVAVTETSPGIFTTTQTGTGQGAILNYEFPNYTPNSPENPAPPGSVITLFATGAGRWEEEIEEASISVAARPFVARPVSLNIAGEPATILYAGAAPYQSMGMLQVNAIVPRGAPSGQQPVVLTIGGTDNAQQKVTIVIR
jgi:uncharacterized protein (TIGR03437 family)